MQYEYGRAEVVIRTIQGRIFSSGRTHREEYSRFSRLMTNGDERQYLAICKAIFRQLPYQAGMGLSRNDDSTDGLANINMQFAENAVPGIVGCTRNRGRKTTSARQHSTTTLWGRIKSFWRQILFQAGCHPFGTARVELALALEEQRSDGFHDRETDEKNPKADNADGLGCSLQQSSR